MEFEYITKPILNNMYGHFYKLLPAEEQDGDWEQKSKTEKAARRSENLKTFSIIGAIVAVLALATVGVRFVATETSSGQHPFLSDCGSTREEAISKGCKFDMLSFSYIPPACDDAALCHEFCRVHEWEFFLDENMTQSISRADVENGTVKHVYTSREWEELQCVYTWRKVYRAALKGKPVDNFSMDREYSDYCGDLLVETSKARHEGRAVDRLVFETELKYLECRA